MSDSTFFLPEFAAALALLQDPRTPDSVIQDDVDRRSLAIADRADGADEDRTVEDLMDMHAIIALSHYLMAGLHRAVPNTIDGAATVEMELDTWYYSCVARLELIPDQHLLRKAFLLPCLELAQLHLDVASDPAAPDRPRSVLAWVLADLHHRLAKLASAAGLDNEACAYLAAAEPYLGDDEELLGLHRECTLLVCAAAVERRCAMREPGVTRLHVAAAPRCLIAVDAAGPPVPLGLSDTVPRLRRISEIHRRKKERSGSISSIASLLPAAMEVTDADPIANVVLPAILPEPTHLPLRNSWNFDVWSYTHAELLVFLVDMFADLGLLHTFRIEPDTFLEFLKSVEPGYKLNPYHNFRHAFDMTQAGYLFLRTCCACESDESYTPPSTGTNKFDADFSGAAQASTSAPAASSSPPRKIPRLMFTLQEQLAFMLACVCHDLEHDGKTNNFHIVTQSDLAVLYNDQSPLENRHMHEASRLIAKHALLAQQTRTVQAEIRQLMVRSILSTDLAKHVDILAKFNEICPAFDATDREHRARSLEMLIKCADVSNVIRPLHLAKGWSDCIQEEMFQQGDVEREQGLPVSGFGDRLAPQSARLGMSFSEYMCAPLFRTMGKAIPRMEAYLKNIAVTRDYWVGVLAETETDTEEGTTTTGSSSVTPSSSEGGSAPASRRPSEALADDSVIGLGPTSRRRSSSKSVTSATSSNGSTSENAPAGTTPSPPPPVQEEENADSSRADAAAASDPAALRGDAAAP
ncbi:3',5'-cyclic-nucleotide phosphodiesterase [Blastocladiella emersonii ATCC 22665]|nr:3',5'-cyclic-nucleotide phosphodiesterase [Blastocladiella emersonii ATCC 22665]